MPKSIIFDDVKRLKPRSRRTHILQKTCCAKNENEGGQNKMFFSHF